MENPKAIMNWLKTQPNIAAVPTRTVYKNYQNEFKDQITTLAKFSRFMESQWIGRKSLRYQNKIYRAYDPKLNPNFDFIPPIQKLKCPNCNGLGYIYAHTQQR